MFAYEQSEKYKEGKFIIEKEYMVKNPMNKLKTDEDEKIEESEQEYEEEIVEEGGSSVRIRRLIRHDEKEDEGRTATDRITQRNTNSPTSTLTRSQANTSEMIVQ